jgi:tRNA-splicing ligase RtcB
MNVPVRVYADEELLRHIVEDKALEQAVNVAWLPGIVRYALAMPDAHWGYGFPIGGVAAMDPENGGVVSPGGIGFDINCGVRMIRTDLTGDDVRPRIDTLVAALFHAVPCGVGAEKAVRRLSESDLDRVMTRGAGWAVENGFGRPEDLERTEEHGALESALPETVSAHARKRGAPQMGTLGSGNHFLEVDVVDRIDDAAAADALGVFEGQMILQVHCGSRGFGHQVCSDWLKTMQRAAERAGIELPDKQLACAPLGTREAREYLGAMACAANYAWANRQTIMHLAIEALAGVFGGDRDSLGARLIYDVCHNIAKWETYPVEGEMRRLCVHRKGATRAFPPGHPQTPEPYREVGQPVLVPGDMGTHSYLCVGTRKALDETFGSTCHGAGRMMSRHAAVRKGRGHNIANELKTRGITVRAKDRRTLAEEMPDAYKDVDAVVGVMAEAGIVRRVARLRPIGVAKG